MDFWFVAGLAFGVPRLRGSGPVRGFAANNSCLTFHPALRDITHHASRITFHVSRFSSPLTAESAPTRLLRAHELAPPWPSSCRQEKWSTAHRGPNRV